jgi:heterotetrameric sarcosine oxidase gamma subunit
VADTPIARSPFGDLPEGWQDLSLQPKWRTFVDPSSGCAVGNAIEEAGRLVWSVSPGEWTVLGPPPDGVEVVDLTHVRAMLRMPAADGLRVLPRVCALDLDRRMFPSGAAARTPVAGVPTEIVRETSAFVLAISRSYGAYLIEALV